MVLGKKLQPVIRNIVFDGNNAVKNIFRFQDGHRMSHGDKRTCLLIKVKDRIHHQKLLFHGNAGIIFMECILLKKSKPDHAGNFQDELLIVGTNITSDQLDNFKQAAFLI